MYNVINISNKPSQATRQRGLYIRRDVKTVSALPMLQYGQTYQRRNPRQIPSHLVPVLLLRHLNICLLARQPSLFA